MKKLLYVLPLLLAGLCITPFAIYKDKVDFAISKNPNAEFSDFAEAFTKLSPGHWKLQDYSTGGAVNLENATFSFDSSEVESSVGNNLNSEPPKAEPISQGARFYGFPFAAYFTKSSSTQVSSSSSYVDASAYSWLWILIDVLLIVVTLIIAIIFNRRKKASTINSQPLTQPAINPRGITPTVLQQDNSQSAVIRPNQLPQQPPNQVFTPSNPENSDNPNSNS